MRLAEGVQSLTDTQLQLRPAPGHWPLLGDGGSSRGCPRHKDHPRGGNDLVWALDSTWKMVERCLERWTPQMLDDEFPRVLNGKTQVFTRQSVIMRLVTHDAYHCGEISQVFGMNGLPELDL